MNYSIDSRKKTSAYLQLYTQIKKDILDEVYKFGDKLPSKRTIASESSTSVITVEHAYSILCDEGYVEAKQRSGYFVIYRQKDFFSDIEQNPPMSYTTQNNPSASVDFPFSIFAKTMRNVLSKCGSSILDNSQNFGCAEFRLAISNYLGRSKGIKITPDQIVIGAGAEYLYGLIVQFLGRNKIYAIEDPSYEKIYSVYKANGAQCDLLKLGNDGILSSELKKTKAKVLHITPYRSFPSGITASASKRNEYIQWALKNKAIIIEDDFDSEFTISSKNEDTVFSLEPEKSVIYLNTFTKTIAPSMRIGYMILPKQLKPLFNDKLGFYSCPVPLFEQYVLADFINSGHFERHINRVRRKRRQLLYNS